MIDFRKYHQAHEMLINLQRGVLSPEALVGSDFDDPRRTAVGYLATKMLKARDGARNITVLVGRYGQPFLSRENAERSKTFKALKNGELVWRDTNFTAERYEVRFMMEIGGFGIVVHTRNAAAQAA